MVAATLVDRRQNDLEYLAEEIAQSVMSDTSQPTADNRHGWLSEVELWSALQLPIGRDKGQWDLVFEVSRRASQIVEERGGAPSGQALLLVTALNATRRMPKCSTDELVARFQSCMNQIEDGAQKKRLDDLITKYALRALRTIKS